MCPKILLITVLTLSVLGVSKSDDFAERTKRQGDVWYWGYHNTYVPTNFNNRDPIFTTNQAQNIQRPALRTTTTTTTTSSPEEEENPCITPKAPNYRQPGRRISEVKCLEVLWYIQKRIEGPERKKKCDLYVIKHKLSVPFVIGGRAAAIGEFPHMAAIGWKSSGNGTWVFKCGGSLISEKFVLTAAHCTKVSARDPTVADRRPQIVRLGDQTILDEYDPKTDKFRIEHDIEKIISHPMYKAPIKYYDIALLQLKYAVFEYSSAVQPACLWTKPDTRELGTTATVTGWGVIETVNLTTSPILQVGAVDIIDSQTCDAYLENAHNRLWNGVAEHQICAGKIAGGVDACQGDSGGPLQVPINLADTSQGHLHYLIGVTSFGLKCALKETPGIYTKVSSSSILDWIENTVWPEG